MHFNLTSFKICFSLHCFHLLYFQVGLAKDDALTHQLIDYLMGEVDGIPKVYLKNRFHFCVHLYCNKSQMRSRRTKKEVP